MKLFHTKINNTSAYVFAENTQYAISKFNRLRRLLHISHRLGYVQEVEVNLAQTLLAQQVQTLLGEPIYSPPCPFKEAEEKLKAMLSEVA